MARTPRRDETRPIHNRVKIARAEVGMSRAELARLVDVNPQTIGALERGDHYPSLQLALSICEVFGLPVEALFSRRPFQTLVAGYRRSDDADQGDAV